MHTDWKCTGVCISQGSVGIRTEEGWLFVPCMRVKGLTILILFIFLPTFQNEEEFLWRSESEPGWFVKLDVPRQLEGGATLTGLKIDT